MSATTTLTMAGGIQVIVPDDPERITPYVLEEQQDWFEDEIEAVRSLLRPGQSVIDIGANLGVYALSMARVVGQEGRVIAFEPAADTAALLRASARLNGFDQLAVQQQGVGARRGVACLAIGDDSELNQLIEPESDSGAGRAEEVPIISLDDWQVESGASEPIAFIKIDAEGQELNILRGAERLLREQSPLILYEVKHGLELHLELVDAFAALGYDSYRLLPGPQLLEPFSAGREPDGFLLNLFACRPGTARELARQGRLSDVSGRSADEDAEASALPVPGDAHHWSQALRSCPYARALGPLWTQRARTADGEDTPLSEALALHALSLDLSRSARDRALALHRSVTLLRQACLSGAAPVHLASLARVARAAGERVLAVEALDSLISALPWMQLEDLSEPFLAPWPRFEAVEPGESPQAWLMAAAIEAHECLRHYSSFFTGPLLRDRLDYALSLGYGSEALERRRRLIDRRFHTAQAA